MAVQQQYVHWFLSLAIACRDQQASIAGTGSGRRDAGGATFVQMTKSTPKAQYHSEFFY